MNPLLETALARAKSGVSIIPTKTDLSKQPVFSLLPEGQDGKATWAPFKSQIAPADVISSWFTHGPVNIAAIGGAVSGGLVGIDFDNPRFYYMWRQSVGMLADGLIIESTPRPGYRVVFRCNLPLKNEKLAYEEAPQEPEGRSAAIETKCEGGYFLISPSRNPQGVYEHVAGSWDKIPTLTDQHAQALLDAARALDECPITHEQRQLEVKARVEIQSKRSGQDSVIDRYNEKFSIHDVLRVYGYKVNSTGTRAIRPGSDHNTYSVSILDGRYSYHHHPSDRLSDGHAHDAFDIVRVFEYGGDYRQAVREIGAYLDGRPVDDDVRIEIGQATRLLNGQTSNTGDFETVVISSPVSPVPPTPQEQAQRDTDIGRFHVYSAQDALDFNDPIEWVIQDLFSAGSVNVIVGEPGSKKTWSMLDAAIAQALGREWLGKPTIGGPVLVIDEESGRRRLSERIRKIIKANKADGKTPVWYVTLANFDFGNAADLIVTEALIVEYKARMVIIDALADIMPGADENAVNEVQPIMRALRGIAERTRAAIVIIHHSNKAGGYRGSSAIKGAVDLMLMVESRPDEQAIQFRFEKARDVEPFRFGAVAMFAEDSFYLAKADVVEREQKKKKVDIILDFFRTSGGKATISDVKFSGIGGNLHKEFQILERDGLIKRTREYDGQAQVWELVNDE